MLTFTYRSTPSRNEYFSSQILANDRSSVEGKGIKRFPDSADSAMSSFSNLEVNEWHELICTKTSEKLELSLICTTNFGQTGHAKELLKAGLFAFNMHEMLFTRTNAPSLRGRLHEAGWPG